MMTMKWFAQQINGGRAQVPSLPVDDPLKRDEKGVYSTYTLLAPPMMAICPNP